MSSFQQTPLLEGGGGRGAGGGAAGRGGIKRIKNKVLKM